MTNWTLAPKEDTEQEDDDDEAETNNEVQKEEGEEEQDANIGVSAVPGQHCAKAQVSSIEFHPTIQPDSLPA